MSVKAVIFDFGGVLVRTEDTSSRERWEARLDLPDWGLSNLIFDSEVSTRAQLGQATEDEVWQHVVQQLDLDSETFETLRRDFWAGDQLDTRLVDFLRNLRPAYKTAILSNAWPSARETFVEIFGLDDAVDAMIISAEEGVMKPDPRIYHIAAERLGVQPQEAVFVDDFSRNIEGARAVGMQAILFHSTQQVIAEVRRRLE